MKTQHTIRGKVSLSSGLAVALVLGLWLSGAARAAEPMDGAQHLVHMQHITTQAQAEALKPGDSMSMTCAKCKDVMVQKVTTDKAHVKMMTVGEKVMCHGLRWHRRSRRHRQRRRQGRRSEACLLEVR